MNIKKILAATAASVMTVSVMSVGASAKMTTAISDETLFKNDGGIYKLNLKGGVEDGATTPGVDITKVAGVSVVFTFDVSEEAETWTGGSIVFASPKAGWTQRDWTSGEPTKTQVKAVSGEKTTVQLTESPFAADDEWVNISFQDFADGKTGAVDFAIDSIELLDASGAVLVKVDSTTKGTAQDGGNQDPTGDENKPTGDENNKPTGDENNKPTGDENNKKPVDTGVAGIAAVVGVAVVAAGAMVVAKKRK